MNLGNASEAIVDQGPHLELPAGPQQMQRSTEAWLFLGIAVIAAILRLLVIGDVHRVLSKDSIDYIEIAKNIGNSFSFFAPEFPPGYPMWIALLQKLTGLGWVEAGEWTSFVFSLLLFFPLYAVFRRCVSVPSALLGLLFYACLPLWVRYGTAARPMAAASFWFFLSLVLSLSAIVRPHRRVIILACAGISLGLAALSRPELLVGAVVLPFWVIYRCRESLRSIGPWLVMCACFVVYSPYVLMIHKQTGHWQIAMKTASNVRVTMAVGKYDWNAAVEKNMQSSANQFPSRLPSFWFSNPWATVKRIGINGYLLHEYAWPELFPAILTFFLALGLVMSGASNIDAIGVVSLIYLPSLTFHPDARVMLPWATTFLAWAGAGASFLLQYKRRIGIATLICAVVLLVGSSLHLRRQGENGIVARSAGIWLGAHASRHGAWVWSREYRVAFYAGMKHHVLPKDAGIDAFIKPMRAGDWLVVDNHRFSLARPKAFAQFFAGNIPSRLILAKQFTGLDGHILNLYRLAPTSVIPSSPGGMGGDFSGRRH